MADLERIERALRAAHAAGDREAAARLAVAYREAQARGVSDDGLPGNIIDARRETGERFIGALGSAARDVNTGILRGLGQGNTRLATEAGRLGITRPRGEEAEGMAGSGFEMIGMAAPAAIGGVGALGARYAAPAVSGALSSAPLRAATVPSSGGALDRMGREIADTAISRPGMFYGSEAGAAFGAGALQRGAEDEGGGPLMQMVAALMGGLGGSAAPLALNRGATGLMQGVASHLAPFTEAGALPRAQRALQSRAMNPDRAAENVTQFNRQGVTPARASGDEGLMAVESRILADNPQLRDRVNADLQTARVAAQNELRDEFGEPRTRQQWERAVLERVGARHADGTPVAPIQGTQTDEMLDSTYRGFDTLYNAARGHRARLVVPREGGGGVGIGQAFKEAVADPDVIANPSTRRSVGAFLNEQNRTLTRTAGDDGMVPTDAIIEVRRRLRDEQRAILRGGSSTEERAQARLLENAERRMTMMLEDALPPDVAANLRAADRQYGQYKVVEDAVYRSADLPMTPEMLSASIQSSTRSPGRYARGQNESEQALRDLVLSGRSTETVFGDPRRASLMVRGLDDEGKRAIHADFANTLFRRARDSGQTVEGQTFISGEKLLRDLNEQREVARALDISGQQFARMRRIAQEIRRMEASPPEAVTNLLADGPATMMQLGAALLGAKSGQRVAGSGLGSSLVLAQFMSNKARGALTMITGDHAEKMLRDAATDPDLYRALLVGRSSPRRRIDEAAQSLNAWLLANVAPADEAAQEFMGGLPPIDDNGG